MNEVWKEIIKLESLRHSKVYEVSNTGKVRTYNPRHPIDSPKGSYRELKPQHGGSNKQYLKIQVGSKIGYKYVHHLVLEAFIGACPNGCNANHKDHNTFNNHIDNLEWCTYSKNSQEMQNFYGGVNQYTKHNRRIYGKGGLNGK